MEVIKWLSIADRYTKMHLDKALAALRLNSSQYMYVIRICQSPGMTQDCFFEQFYVNPSNITRSLAYLEKEGFIRKEVNPEDKRTCRLYPTQKALDAQPEIEAAIEGWEALLLDGMSCEEIHKFKAQLEYIGQQAVQLCPKESSVHEQGGKEKR